MRVVPKVFIKLSRYIKYIDIFYKLLIRPSITGVPYIIINFLKNFIFKSSR